MRKFDLVLLPLVFCCFLIISPTINAVNLKTDAKTELYLESDNGIPQFVSGKLSVPVTPGLEVKATHDFFEANKDQFRMNDPKRELLLKNVETDKTGYQHLRFDQYYKSLRVYGGQMVSHFNAEGILYAVNGDYYADLDLPTIPTTSITNAEAIARENIDQKLASSDLIESELVVFKWEETDYLVWRLILFSEFPMGRWEYFIDALTSEIIFKANRIMADSYEIGIGNGILGGARTHLDTKLIDSIYYLMDYTRQANNDIHGHGGQMPDGRYIRTYIASSGLPGLTATDSDNIWNAIGSQASAVDGHFYSMLMYDWMLRVFDRNSYDDGGANMNTSVSYSAEGNNNAYWNGSRIVIWTASPGYRELAACPDVVAHEWGHAITTYTSGLIYQKESGALNESFSDMIGTAFEFAHDSVDTPDWYMGENISSGSTGFRNISDPHSKNDPDYYGNSDPYWVYVDGCTPTNDNDWCGVHTNSGVGNKWFYLLSQGGTHYDSTVIGIGNENAILIAYHANRHYWTYNSTYIEAAYGTMLAAIDLDTTGTWLKAVEDAWVAVGVYIPENEISITYPWGIPNALEYNVPTTVQFRVNSVFHGTPVRHSGQIHYSVDGEPEIVVPLDEYSTNRYRYDLPALDCGSQIKFYFSAEEVDNGRFYDPAPASPHIAVPTTDTTDVIEWDLSYQPGFTLENDWAYGRPNGKGGYDGGVRDPSEAYTGSNIYGYNLDGDYLNNLDASHLTTAPFDCTDKSNVLLSFYRWLGVDAPENDHALISASTDSINWTTVWENEQRIDDLDWQYMEVDISEVADNQPVVYLRWTIGPTNIDWHSCGWNIDDIKIVSRGCTPWICGDLTGDLLIDLSDITRMIDHVYLSKEPLDNNRAGNVDGTISGIVDLADITRLIDHIYITRSDLFCL